MRGGSWLAVVALSVGCGEDHPATEPAPDLGLYDAAPDADLTDVTPDADLTDAALDADLTDAAPDARPDVAPPLCPEEDRLAPNHDLDAAAVVVPGFTADDLFLCPGARDLFALDLVEGQRLLAVLDARPPTTDLDLLLRDAEGQIRLQSAGASGREKLTFSASASGRYYLEVSGYHGASAAYTLALRGQCESDGQCPERQVCDPFEGLCIGAAPPRCGADAYEPNDRDSDGAPLGLDPVEGRLCQDDRDWFTFEAAPGDTVEIQALADPEADVDLVAVELATGMQVSAVFNDARTNPERLILSHLPGGRYAVGVFLYSAEGGPDREVGYRLDLIGAGGRCAHDDHCLTPEQPRCDVATGACGRPWAPGQVALGDQCGRSSDCAAPADLCWRGRAGGGDNLCTHACRRHDDCDALGDGARCVAVSSHLALCQPPCAADADCTDFRTCEAGLCDLIGPCQVDADCPGDAICRLTEIGLYCGRRPAPSACDGGPDEISADVATDAAPLRAPAAGELCHGDEDWYALEIPPGASNLTLRAESEAPLAVAIYNAGNALIAHSDGAPITLTPPPAGRLLVRLILQPEALLGAHGYTLSADLDE